MIKLCESSQHQSLVFNPKDLTMIVTKAPMQTSQTPQIYETCKSLQLKFRSRRSTALIASSSKIHKHFMAGMERLLLYSRLLSNDSPLDSTALTFRMV